MLESIILKLCRLLGDRYGYDTDDLLYEAELNQYEHDYIKDLLEAQDV